MYGIYKYLDLRLLVVRYTIFKTAFIPYHKRDKTDGMMVEMFEIKNKQSRLAMKLGSTDVMDLLDSVSSRVLTIERSLDEPTPSPIVFTATSSGGTSAGNIVIFKKVIQEDDSYNPSNGYFTAPFAGFLSCQFTINKSYTHQHVHAELFQNENSICNGRSQNYPSPYHGYIQAGCSADIKVNRGDKIYIKVRSGTSESSYGSFSGILIPACTG